MKWRLWIPGVAAAVLLAMPCSGQAQTARVRLATKEVSLGKVHPGIYPPSLTVSPDSRRVAYGTRSGSKQFVVVDGAESQEYDGFLPGSQLMFDTPTSLHALASRGQEIIRIEIDIVEE